MTQHLEHRTSDSFDGWLTPEWVLNLVRQVGDIHFDPCTEKSNPTGAEHFATHDGLGLDWSVFGSLVYVNSPYGRALPGWADKVVEEASKGLEILMLVPARTETNWFGYLWDNADSVALFRKRIKFWHPSQPGKDSPKFPNAMFYFGKQQAAFTHAFVGAARVLELK